MNKVRTDKFWKNGVMGFILAAVPIVIIYMEAMISEKYSISFITKIIENAVIYGLIGFAISIGYTYASKRYPKLSRYTLIAIIIGYYIFSLVLLVMGIYIDRIGR